MCVTMQVCSLEELLRRPHVGYDVLDANGAGCHEMSDIQKTSVEIDIKYSGFVARQEQQLKKMQGKFRLFIPKDMDYSVIPSLSSEAQEKLDKIRPDSIGQAARIGGVNPADISALLVFMESRRRSRQAQAPEQPAPQDENRLQATAA
jgi:tRNA uridine 5-carboxymethylaminomethyl modification enzyme